MQLEFITWISGCLEKTSFTDHMAENFKKGQTVKQLVFLEIGTIEYVIESCNVPYFTWTDGETLGLEDFIYRMSVPHRSLLVDGRMSFCHFNVASWPKRKFTPKKQSKFATVFVLDLHAHLKEWQRRFPIQVDDFFRLSLTQLLEILKRRISTMKELLKIPQESQDLEEDVDLDKATKSLKVSQKEQLERQLEMDEKHFENM